MNPLTLGAAALCGMLLFLAGPAARAQPVPAAVASAPPVAPGASPGKMNVPLAVGLGVLGCSYVPSAIAGIVIATNDTTALPLVLPVVGPLITMEMLSVDAETRWLFGAASFVQAVGVVSTLIGVALPDDRSMPDKIARLQVQPVVTAGGAGVVLTGGL